MKYVLIIAVLSLSACAEPWQNTVPAPKVYTGKDLPVEHAIQRTVRVSIRCERFAPGAVDCEIK